MTGPAGHDRDERAFLEAMREQILATPLPASRRRALVARPIRTRLAVAGAGLALPAALAALIIALLTSVAHPPPAYAVTTTSGSVTIYLSRDHQPAAMRALNARLAFLHTRIRVVPIVAGCVAPVRVAATVYGGFAHIAPGPPRTLEVDRLGPPGSGTHFSVAPGERVAPPDTTLILPVTRSGRLSVTTPIVIGSVPRCVGLRAS